jgi:hypothetical protein
MIYNYTRTFSNGNWTINNIKDVDEIGNPITLAERIKEDATVGTKLVRVDLNDITASVEISEDLSAPDKTILDNIVAAHEAASGSKNITTYIQMTSPNGTEYLMSVTNAGSIQIDLA